MSLHITLTDDNNTVKTVLVEEGTTFSEILEMDEVVELCDPEDPEDVVTSIAGNCVEGSPRLKRALLADEAEDGDNIDFAVEFPVDEEEIAEELGVDQTAAPTGAADGGHVIVQVSGGIVRVTLTIGAGLRTVADALSNSAVRTRSGMSAAELSEATVNVPGFGYLGGDADRRGVALTDGMVIDVNPRQASNKGA